MSSLFGKLRDFVAMSGSEDYEEYGGDYEELPAEEYETPYASGSSQSWSEPESDRTSHHTETQQGSNMNTSAINAGAINTGASNVVGMPGSRLWGSAEVLVLEPRAFEEMPMVIQALKERKSVVLNLTMMDPSQAQRAVDFVAGATYTIDGHQERVGDSIFLFTPNCVQVSSQVGGTDEAPQALPQPLHHGLQQWLGKTIHSTGSPSSLIGI